MPGRSFLILLAATFLCRSECVQVGPQKFSRVEVAAFSAIGERLPNLDVDLIEVGTQKSLKSQFRSALALKIPYGTYRLRVSASGFAAHYEELRIDQPEVLLRTQLSVGVECQGYAQLGGNVRPAPNSRELWLKLVPVRGDGGAEARVGQDGAFQIAGLDNGDYFLLVTDAGSILHTETVRILGTSTVTVRLSNN